MSEVKIKKKKHLKAHYADLKEKLQWQVLCLRFAKENTMKNQV